MQFEDSVLNNLYDRYTVDGEAVVGQSISFLQGEVRRDGFSTGNLADFRNRLESLGFTVKPGTNSRGRRATVVTL